MVSERVVVVGAGIGGLVAAALLAARGRDVTVVEAAAAPGGKLRQVDAGGVAVDAGPTVFTLRGLFDEIFEAAGADLDDHVTLKPAETLARHAWGDARLDLFADADRSEAAIAAFAGAAEARGYRAFRAEAKRMFVTLEHAFLRAPLTNPIGLTWRLGVSGFADLLAIRPYETLWGALGGHFRDPRLRQLFARYATYCGSSPFHAPATLMLIAHVEASGVWLIEGGMHALARALETVARRQGACFRYGAAVREIRTARGRAVGVTLADGERVDADVVVCNADPAALAAGALGENVRRAVRGIAPRDRSLSAMAWMARAKTGGFPLLRHNVFFSDDYPAEFAALSSGRTAERPSVYVCAQGRDDASGSPPPGAREPLQIIVNAPPIGDTHVLAPTEIMSCTMRMLATLERAGLSLELSPDATVLATPNDFERMFPSTGGALYGRASHGWAASFRRQGARTRIPGLYCVGGSTHPGAGVPMAALSARLAVDCLLRDRASTARCHPAAMPGGTSTRSATTAASA